MRITTTLLMAFALIFVSANHALAREYTVVEKTSTYVSVPVGTKKVSLIIDSNNPQEAARIISVANSLERQGVDTTIIMEGSGVLLAKKKVRIKRPTTAAAAVRRLEKLRQRPLTTSELPKQLTASQAIEETEARRRAAAALEPAPSLADEIRNISSRSKHPQRPKPRTYNDLTDEEKHEYLADHFGIPPSDPGSPAGPDFDPNYENDSASGDAFQFISLRKTVPQRAQTLDQKIELRNRIIQQAKEAEAQIRAAQAEQQRREQEAYAGKEALAVQLQLTSFSGTIQACPRCMETYGVDKEELLPNVKAKYTNTVRAIHVTRHVNL